MEVFLRAMELNVQPDDVLELWVAHPKPDHFGLYGKRGDDEVIKGNGGGLELLDELDERVCFLLDRLKRDGFLHVRVKSDPPLPEFPWQARGRERFPGITFEEDTKDSPEMLIAKDIARRAR